MYLDENDDEVWRSWSCEPVRSIEEALREVTHHGSWVYCYPIAIHPEYRIIMSKLIQAAVEEASLLTRNLPVTSQQRLF